MSRRWWFVVLWLGLAVVLALPRLGAWANAAPPEAAGGGNPGPDNRTQVRMVREQVRLRLNPQGDRAAVEGVYVMQNQGEQAENLQVLYPLRFLFTQCEGQEIQNLRVWVDDRQVTTQRIEGQPRPQGCEAPTPWAAFPVTFPPGQEVTLRVQYEQAAWGYPPYLVVTYILETGAGWYGTIGEADIAVRLPYPASEETIPLSPDFWGYGQGTTPNARLEGDTVRWLFQNLEPTSQDNIFLLYLRPDYWQEIQRRRQAVRDRPKDGEAWGFLGLAIKKALLLPGAGYPMRFDDPGAQKLIQEALQAYERAVQLKPRDADWHYGYGQMLALVASHTQDPARRAALLQRAAQEFRTALELKPGHEKTLAFYNEMSWLLEGWMAQDGDTFVYPGLTATPTFAVTPTPTLPPATTAAPAQATSPPATATPVEVGVASPVPGAPSPIPSPMPSQGAAGMMFALDTLVLLGVCCLGIVVGAGVLLVVLRKRNAGNG